VKGSETAGNDGVANKSVDSRVALKVLALSL
jgi:hypothetical protein